MGLEDRKLKIIEHLKKVGFATFKELADMLNVSEMTVRRDVKKLEKESVINRKYKGIELVKEFNSIITSNFESNVNIHHYYYDSDDINYKIVQEAIKKIIYYKNIFLDSGDLNIEIAKSVALNYKNFTGVDFITSDIKIASILGDINLNVYIISGKVNKNKINIIDYINSQFLNYIIIDLLILEPNAIDIDFGISDNNLFMANTKKLIIDRSKNILLLVKPNHFNMKAIYKITDLDNRFKCITIKDNSKTLSKYEDIMHIIYT